MLKINKLKKIKSNFPVIVGEQIISKKVCNSLIKEISNSKNFDDMIMGGRSRINKGSKNFNKYISSSKISKKLFATFNTELFYKKIDKKFRPWISRFVPACSSVYLVVSSIPLVKAKVIQTLGEFLVFS